MNQASNIDTLRSLPLFKQVSDAQLHSIWALMNTKRYPSQATLVSAQLPSSELYILLKGRVCVSLDNVSGRDLILSVMEPGELIGELGVLDEVGRTANVTALEPVEAIWMTTQAFQEIIAIAPIISHNLARLLARRMRKLIEHARILATEGVQHQTAQLLLHLSQWHQSTISNGEVTIQIGLSQEELSMMIAASRQQFNRAIAHLRRQKIIATSRKRIVICDMQRLRELA